jgi:hypothetical protein
MAELLDATRLQQIEFNPPAEESQCRIPVMCWTIDNGTKRPVFHWGLEAKANSSRLSIARPT